MALDVVIGGLVGGSAIVLGWMRIKAFRTYLRNLRQVDELETALREARELAAGPSPYRVATEADRALVARLATADDETRLAAFGFTLLGDLVIQGDGRAPSAIVRALVDRGSTTAAYFTSSRATTTLTLASYPGGDLFTTRRSLHDGLADPAFVHRQTRALDVPLATLLVDHERFAPHEARIRFATLDELVAVIAANHARVASWRLAQPPDELLDADLRGVLGDHYAKHGKAWARRLRGELPAATLRRK